MAVAAPGSPPLTRHLRIALPWCGHGAAPETTYEIRAALARGGTLEFELRVEAVTAPPGVGVILRGRVIMDAACLDVVTLTPTEREWGYDRDAPWPANETPVRLSAPEAARAAAAPVARGAWVSPEGRLDAAAAWHRATVSVLAFAYGPGLLLAAAGDGLDAPEASLSMTLWRFAEPLSALEIDALHRVGAVYGEGGLWRAPAPRAWSRGAVGVSGSGHVTTDALRTGACPKSGGRPIAETRDGITFAIPRGHSAASMAATLAGLRVVVGPPYDPAALTAAREPTAFLAAAGPPPPAWTTSVALESWARTVDDTVAPGPSTVAWRARAVPSAAAAAAAAAPELVAYGDARFTYIFDGRASVPDAAVAEGQYEDVEQHAAAPLWVRADPAAGADLARTLGPLSMGVPRVARLGALTEGAFSYIGVPGPALERHTPLITDALRAANALDPSRAWPVGAGVGFSSPVDLIECYRARDLDGAFAMATAAWVADAIAGSAAGAGRLDGIPPCSAHPLLSVAAPPDAGVRSRSTRLDGVPRELRSTGRPAAPRVWDPALVSAAAAGMLAVTPTPHAVELEFVDVVADGTGASLGALLTLVSAERPAPLSGHTLVHATLCAVTTSGRRARPRALGAVGRWALYTVDELLAGVAGDAMRHAMRVAGAAPDAPRLAGVGSAARREPATVTGAPILTSVVSMFTAGGPAVAATGVVDDPAWWGAAVWPRILYDMGGGTPAWIADASREWVEAAAAAALGSWYGAPGVHGHASAHPSPRGVLYDSPAAAALCDIIGACRVVPAVQRASSALARLVAREGGTVYLCTPPAVPGGGACCAHEVSWWGAAGALPALAPRPPGSAPSDIASYGFPPRAGAPQLMGRNALVEIVARASAGQLPASAPAVRRLMVLRWHTPPPPQLPPPAGRPRGAPCPVHMLRLRGVLDLSLHATHVLAAWPRWAGTATPVLLVAHFRDGDGRGPLVVVPACGDVDCSVAVPPGFALCGIAAQLLSPVLARTGGPGRLPMGHALIVPSTPGTPLPALVLPAVPFTTQLSEGCTLQWATLRDVDWSGAGPSTAHNADTGTRPRAAPRAVPGSVATPAVRQALQRIRDAGQAWVDAHAYGPPASATVGDRGARWRRAMQGACTAIRVAPDGATESVSQPRLPAWGLIFRHRMVAAPPDAALEAALLYAARVARVAPEDLMADTTPRAAWATVLSIASTATAATLAYHPDIDPRDALQGPAGELHGVRSHDRALHPSWLMGGDCEDVAAASRGWLLRLADVGRSGLAGAASAVLEHFIVALAHVYGLTGTGAPTLRSAEHGGRYLFAHVTCLCLPRSWIVHPTRDRAPHVPWLMEATMACVPWLTTDAAPAAVPEPQYSARGCALLRTLASPGDDAARRLASPALASGPHPADAGDFAYFTNVYLDDPDAGGVHEMLLTPPGGGRYMVSAWELGHGDVSFVARDTPGGVVAGAVAESELPIPALPADVAALALPLAPLDALDAELVGVPCFESPARPQYVIEWPLAALVGGRLPALLAGARALAREPDVAGVALERVCPVPGHTHPVLRVSVWLRGATWVAPPCWV